MVVRADRDFYQILGVARDADKKTIKSAYRQLARKYHPVRLLKSQGGEAESGTRAVLWCKHLPVASTSQWQGS